jgi:hypothetical protein
MLRDIVHPLASVTVTVYVPAESPAAVVPVCAGIVFHEYVYGDVPPEGVAVAVPSEPPEHATSVFDRVADRAAAGCVMITGMLLRHRLMSRTDIV